MYCCCPTPNRRAVSAGLKCIPRRVASVRVLSVFTIRKQSRIFEPEIIFNEPPVLDRSRRNKRRDENEYSRYNSDFNARRASFYVRFETLGRVYDISITGGFFSHCGFRPTRWSRPGDGRPTFSHTFSRPTGGQPSFRF